MGKVIITEEKNRLLVTLFDEKQPVFMETAALPQEESILGNIYLAKVQEVVRSIQSAFLMISDGQTVYLPLADQGNYLCANRKLEKGEFVRPGDELVIQISTEALKTKLPTASGKLTLTGKYCVCSFPGHGITYSKKLSLEKKQAIEEQIQSVDMQDKKTCKFTIRTNAGSLNEYTPVLEEMACFAKTFQHIQECYKHRTVYSCLYQTPAEVLKVVQDISLLDYDEIVTDVDAVYELLQRESVMIESKAPVSRHFFTEEQKICLYQEKPLRLYHDERISLSKLYSIETHLAQALSKKVWLSCGGYLVLEPTEAMIVIDVNSGKTEKKDKKNDHYFLKVNLEAAEEIARQLRLRNYSGMILVDFINMDSEADKEQLIRHLDVCLKKDRIPTRLVDMTALGIVEITRKKRSKPLAEFFLNFSKN